MCFVWISGHMAITFEYRINRLVFVTETEIVYWAVRTGSLYVKQICFAFKGLMTGWSTAQNVCCYFIQLHGRFYSLIFMEPAAYTLSFCLKMCSICICTGNNMCLNNVYFPQTNFLSSNNTNKNLLKCWPQVYTLFLHSMH
jgi:hypothetical protein